MFDKMKQLIEMQKKMQEVKRDLDNTHFEVASSDGLVKITMNGSQNVCEVKIQGDLEQSEKSQLENSLKDAYNQAIKHSHELAAGKMKDIVGLNLPGVF
jgi:DNA-binding YbaB/EbfC family protein